MSSISRFTPMAERNDWQELPSNNEGVPVLCLEADLPDRADTAEAMVLRTKDGVHGLTKALVDLKADPELLLPFGEGLAAARAKDGDDLLTLIASEEGQQWFVVQNIEDGERADVSLAFKLKDDAQRVERARERKEKVLDQILGQEGLLDSIQFSLGPHKPIQLAFTLPDGLDLSIEGERGDMDRQVWQGDLASELLLKLADNEDYLEQLSQLAVQRYQALLEGAEEHVFDGPIFWYFDDLKRVGSHLVSVVPIPRQKRYILKVFTSQIEPKDFNLLSLELRDGQLVLNFVPAFNKKNVEVEYCLEGNEYTIDGDQIYSDKELPEAIREKVNTI